MIKLGQDYGIQLNGRSVQELFLIISR